MAEFSMDDLMFRPGLMKGQRILITGGGTGLGKVMAEACVMLGADVYICGRRGGVVEAAAKDLTDAHGGKCVGIACDIRVPEAIADMIDTVWADGGGIADVDAVARDLSAVFVGQFHRRRVAHRLAPAADDDLRAQFDEPRGHLLAEAGAAAGHEDALVLQQPVLEHGDALPVAATRF